MNDVDALIVPPDLDRALASHPPADRNFAAFPTSARRYILRWITSARTPPTRARRIAATMADAARNLSGPVDVTLQRVRDRRGSVAGNCRWAPVESNV